MCSWFSCLNASAVHSPVVFPIFCFYIVAEGVRKERKKMNEVHNANTFSVSLGFLSDGPVRIAPFLRVMFLDHLSSPKENLCSKISPFLLSLFLSFLLPTTFCNAVLSGSILRIVYKLDVTRAGK